MHRHALFLSWLLLLALLPGPGVFKLSALEAAGFYAYNVRQESRVSIHGSTSINRFECISEGGIPNGFVFADTHPHNGQMLFSEALLGLRIDSFECSHRAMNKDFRKALGQEDNPFIDLKLLEAKQINTESDQGAGRIRALVKISINGVSRQTFIEVEWKQTQALGYVFSGEKALRMSDFNIDPPSPAMGLIKVNDEISIGFQLLVETSLITQQSR